MKNSREQVPNLGARPKIQQIQNNGKTRQPNKQLRDQSQPPQQLTDQLSAMTRTDQNTSSRNRIMNHLHQQTTYNV
jgi:hypothetical protein